MHNTKIVWYRIHSKKLIGKCKNLQIFLCQCLTSKDLSFLTAQIQIPMDRRDMNMRGMKTRIQECISVSRLLQARISNISSNRCIPVQITIALNCTWLLFSILQYTSSYIESPLYTCVLVYINNM